MTDSYLLVATEATEQIFVYSRSIEEKAIFALLWEGQNLGNGILLIIVLSDAFNGCALCILKYAIKTVSRSKI